MSLRAALLALLSAGPLTGYDVAKHFAASVGHVWNAPDSQIYPELRKMEREGLLDGHEVPWGSRGATKTEYTLTDAGVTALRDWADSPVAYTPSRDQARLKAAYLEWTDLATARSHLEAHLAQHQAERQLACDEHALLESRTSPVLVRRLAAHPDADADAIVGFKLLAYRNAILRAEAEIAWAREGLALVDRLEQRSTRGRSGGRAAPGGRAAR